jgi:hypothetical protein
MMNLSSQKRRMNNLDATVSKVILYKEILSLTSNREIICNVKVNRDPKFVCPVTICAHQAISNPRMCY